MKLIRHSDMLQHVEYAVLQVRCSPRNGWHPSGGVCARSGRGGRNARTQHEVYHFAIRAFVPPVAGAAHAVAQQVRGQLFVAMFGCVRPRKIRSSVPLAFWSGDVFLAQVSRWAFRV